jgi:hypothetical protein
MRDPGTAMAGRRLGTPCTRMSQGAPLNVMVLTEGVMAVAEQMPRVGSAGT